MQGRWTKLMLVIVSMLLLVVSACSGGAAAPEQGQAPASGAASNEPLKLTMMWGGAEFVRIGLEPHRVDDYEMKIVQAVIGEISMEEFQAHQVQLRSIPELKQAFREYAQSEKDFNANMGE